MGIDTDDFLEILRDDATRRNDQEATNRQLKALSTEQQIRVYRTYLNDRGYGYRQTEQLGFVELLSDWAGGRIPEVYAYRKLTGGRLSCGKVIDARVVATYGANKTLKLKLDYDDAGNKTWITLENVKDVKAFGTPERNPSMSDITLFKDGFGRDLNIGEMVSFSEGGRLVYGLVNGYTPSGHQIIIDVFYILNPYSKTHNTQYQKNKEKGGGLVIVEDEFVKKQLLLQSLGYSGNKST